MDRFPTAILCLTRSCNLSCAYCVVPTIGTIDADEDDLCRAIDILSDRSEFVVILGGEPTISRHLDTTITRLVRNGTPFTMVSNGIRLKHPSFRRHLADNGLTSITVSLDSYKTFSGDIIASLLDTFDDVSVNMIYDAAMIGKLAPIVESLSRDGAWSIVTAYIFFNDDRQHWYYHPRSLPQFAIPPDRIDDVRREMSTIVDRYDHLKIHNSKAYFSSFVDHALDMSWHCTDWNVLFVNNDLRLQFCQDLPASDYTIFDINTKMDELKRAWAKDVGRCNGCYINCYFDAEHLTPRDIRHDR